MKRRGFIETLLAIPAVLSGEAPTPAFEGPIVLRGAAGMYMAIWPDGTLETQCADGSNIRIGPLGMTVRT